MIRIFGKPKPENISSPPSNLFAYIDESGDDGFRFSSGSSNWFILTALVVSVKHHKELMNLVDRIKTILSFKTLNDELHWKRLKHPKRKVIIKEIKNKPFSLISIVVDKQSLSGPDRRSLANFPRMYFFTIKLLLERLTWYARHKKGLIKITFSNKAHVSYTQLQHYINIKLREGTDSHSIDYNHLGPIHVIQSKQRKLLQLADSICGGFYNALQKNNYGDIELSYILPLKDKFWRWSGKLFSYGIKILPSNIEPEIKKSNEVFSLL